MAMIDSEDRMPAPPLSHGDNMMIVVVSNLSLLRRRLDYLVAAALTRPGSLNGSGTFDTY